jgi:hypothetical protein
MHSNRATVITVALLGAALLAGCVDTGTTRPDTGNAAPANLSSLVGMRAQSLDSEMSRRGFTNVGGYKTEGASMTTWWNPSARQCVSVETRQGKVARTEAIFEGNCQ